jgi:hypothetical protein
MNLWAKCQVEWDGKVCGKPARSPKGTKCQSCANKIQYLKNPGKYRETRRLYYQRNKKKLKDNCLLYYYRHREERKLAAALWRHKNAEHVKAYRKAYDAKRAEAKRLAKQGLLGQAAPSESNQGRVDGFL